MGCDKESGRSVLGRSVDTCVGKGGVGETERVASVGSVWGVFVEGGWVIVVGRIGGVSSAIHSLTC